MSSRIKEEIVLANFMVHKNPGCKPKCLCDKVTSATASFGCMLLYFVLAFILFFLKKNEPF